MEKIFKKEVNGVPVRRLLKDIVIEKDGMCTYCPTEDMVLADGWVEHTVETGGEVLLKQAKTNKILDLHEFDKSSEVNDCIIVLDGEELHYWASKTDRDSLKGALNDCISLGRTQYRLDLRELGVYLWIPCEQLLQMLAALEVYASDCYNKTTDHQFAINACATVEEVESYDFKVGYPEIPKFEL